MKDNKVEAWARQDWRLHGTYHYNFNALFKLCRVLVRYPYKDYHYPLALIGIRKSNNLIHTQRIYNLKGRKPYQTYSIKESNHKGNLEMIKFKIDLELLEMGYDLDGLSFGI